MNEGNVYNVLREISLIHAVNLGYSENDFQSMLNSRQLRKRMLNDSRGHLLYEALDAIEGMHIDIVNKANKQNGYTGIYKAMQTVLKNSSRNNANHVYCSTTVRAANGYVYCTDSYTAFATKKIFDLPADSNNKIESLEKIFAGRPEAVNDITAIIPTVAALKTFIKENKKPKTPLLYKITCDFVENKCIWVDGERLLNVLQGMGESLTCHVKGSAYGCLFFDNPEGDKAVLCPCRHYE